MSIGRAEDEILDMVREDFPVAVDVLLGKSDVVGAMYWLDLVGTIAIVIMHRCSGSLALCHDLTADEEGRVFLT